MNQMLKSFNLIFARARDWSSSEACLKTEACVIIFIWLNNWKLYSYFSINNHARHFVILLLYNHIAVKATLQKLQRRSGIVEVLTKDSYGIEPTIHIRLYFVSRCSNQYVMATLDLGLKELWNRVLRIILVWSLFSLIRVYVSLHFLQFLLEN